MNPTDVWKLASFSGTFTMVEHAVQMLGENPFSDLELDAFWHAFDKDRKMQLTARLMDLAEQLREYQEHLDFVVRELEVGLHVDKDAPA